MESLSLLKYLRGGGGGAANAAAVAAKRAAAAAAAAAAVPDDDCRAEDDATSAAADDDDDNDEGPFFDLEFTVPENGANGEENEEEEEKEESAAAEEAEEREFDFAREGFRSEPLSPSDDLFFKGKLLTLDPSSIADADADPETPPHLPVALLKPAAKLRVFLLRLRKPKPAAASPPKPQGRSKLLVKLKVEESPIVSLFTRDNSSRNSASATAAAAASATAAAAAAAEEEDERRFAREVVHKYLSKIKPLYVRVSKRYGEKLGFAEAPISAAAANAGAENDAAEAEAEGEGEAEAEAEEAAPTVAAEAAVAACGVRAARASIPGLKVVRRRLGKSRSASAAVASPRRRDDSLLQQEDGIQSAIAHCKRSFHSAQGSDSPFARCMSDPGDGRSEMEKEACV